MGNIQVTIDQNNSDIITVNASNMTSDQRALAKQVIGYHDVIADPNNPGETMANPIPLVVSVMQYNMTNFKTLMGTQFDANMALENSAEKASVVGTM